MSRGKGRRAFGQKAKSPKKTILRLLKGIFSGHRILLFSIIIAIIVAALSTTYVSMLLKSLIDDYITPLLQSGEDDFRPLLFAMMRWALVMALGVVATYFTGRLMVVRGQDYIRDLRNELFGKLERLPISYFDQHQHGDIMSRFTNDADTLNQMISQSLVQVFSSLLSVICVFVAMCMNSLYLTLVVVTTLCIMLFASKLLAKRSGTYFIMQQKKLGDEGGFIEEMINGIKVVKVFTHESESEKDFDAINEELCLASTKANAYANSMGPVMNNLGNLQYVFLVVVGAAIVIRYPHFYTVGALAAFLQLSRSFTNPIGQIANEVNAILIALAGAERVFAVIDADAESDNGYVTLVNAKVEDGVIKETAEHTGLWAWKHPHQDSSPLTYTLVKGEIEMHDVDFGYVPDKTVLHDVSLTASSGEKIAFVGATGAGKTTITNLLNRFYDIQDGKIRFDGININKIKKSDLRSCLGMVLQDTHLFTGTIADNIRFGALDASDEDVRNAAKLAGADDFIQMMASGYDTVLTNDGEGLSQGQRQLISIARAAIADPPVLVMDEATSSIDTRTEQIVEEGMNRLMKGRTVFVIAHRLSTVREADSIMVLDKGRIIERGSHVELLAQKGVYYKLYTGAFELT